MSAMCFVWLRWIGLTCAAMAANGAAPNESARIYGWAVYLLFVSIYSLADEWMERK